MDIIDMMGSNQIAGLKNMSAKKPTKVIAISGGKGGIGKTNITINLAIALAKKNKRVMVFDADLGLGNVDVLLGLNVRKNLSHVLNGEASLQDIVVEATDGVRVIPASSGVQHMSELSAAEQVGLIQAFSDVTQDVDILLVDTAAGISSDVANFIKASQEVLLVVCNEPTSITDSYATMKVLSRDYGVHKFYVLANMVANAYEGQRLFNKLYRVSERFLDVNLFYAGMVPFDPCVRKAVQKQQAVINAYPGSKAAQAILSLSDKLLQQSFANRSMDSVSFFLEQLIQDEMVLDP